MIELPEKFVEMLGGMPGHEGVAKALAEEESPVSVRLNPAKKMRVPLPETAERIAWEQDGFYLAERPQFTFHTGLYDGRFYVQDASSMILGEAVRRIVGDRTEPLCYLDACAAPGGKTTAAIASLPARSFVLANEYDSSRINALIDNLQRWGSPYYAVSCCDGRRLERVGEIFDIVAADVPCSGEGMMRKNETAATQWSPSLIEQCAELQREIVTAVWKTLKPGGYLIYSTCTFNTQENEDNVRWMCESLGAETIDLGLADFSGVHPALDSNIYGARFLPGSVRGEGQFVAIVRKPADAESGCVPRLSMPRKTVNIPDWLNGEYAGFQDDKGSIYAVAKEYAPLVAHLMSKVNIRVPGTPVAETKGKELRPLHGLATSLALRAGAFSIAEVDYAVAMAFLRGEAITLSDDVVRGYVLVSHNGNRLGWVKNLGSRANNLVPAFNRIKSSHVPEKEPNLFV